MKQIRIFCSVLLITVNCFAQAPVSSFYFEKDKFELANSEIDKLLNSPINPDLAYIIYAYSDDQGSDFYNLWLSQKRAETIRDLLYLKSKVPLENIKVIGLGKSKENIQSLEKRRSDLFVSNEVYLAKSSENRSVSSESEAVANAIKTNESIDTVSKNDLDQSQILIQKINELEKRVSQLELNKNDSEKSDEALDNNVVQTGEKGINKNEERRWYEDYSYLLKINSYSADQAAKYNSGSSFDELLSDPRFSLELDAIKEINKNLSLVHQLGLRWNEYAKDDRLSTDKKWTGLAFKINSGLIYKGKYSLKHRFDIGLQHLLSHSVDGLGIIDLELQMIAKLNYYLITNVFKNKNLDIELSPKIGFIYGLNEIDQGYSIGLQLQTYLGAKRKYFLYGLYEKNSFAQDLRDLEVETLELGFGLKF